MRSKFFAIAVLSMISTMSFAECGMDRKLELVEELRDIREERQLLIESNRNDKKAEYTLKMLAQRERELLYEYEVVCNVN